jgi:hypothetical protein
MLSGGGILETKTFPSEGIAHLILDQVGRDARLQGGSETAVIQITYQRAQGQGLGEFVVEGDALHFRNAIPLRVTLPGWLAVSVGEAAGELRVQDLDGPVLLDVVKGDLRLKDLSSRVQVGQVDGSLRADNVAELRVREGCAGDLRAQGGDALFVETVAGDARLYQLHSARIGRVRGDLWVEKLAGMLEIDCTDGDARLTQIGGPVTLKGVTGDVLARDLAGGLTGTGILGDADLRGPYNPAQEYTLAVGGDLVAYLPLGADLRINVRAGGRIRSDIHLTPVPDGSPAFTASVGRSTGRLALSAGGDVRIVQTERLQPARGTAGAGIGAISEPEGERQDGQGWRDLGERIQQQVSASLASAGIEVETAELNLVPAAATPAPQGGRPARDIIPIRTGGSERRSGMESGGPSDTELMAVLKMIEDGTITASEAEALIEALSAI